MSESTSQKAILVLGMHRSGTSALTRVINLLGARLPEQLLAPDRNNAMGFWEGVELNTAHNELLASAGSSWDDVSAFPAAWYASDIARKFHGRILEILRRDFLDAEVIVIKDPRICRIVPFWLSVLRDFGAEPLFVIPVRNPLEVAASLKARESFSVDRSLLLWLRHVVDAEAETRAFPRSIVFYDDLLRDWKGCMAKIGADIGIHWPTPMAAAAEEISGFLSSAHRHHNLPLDEVAQRQDVIGWVRTVLTALRGDSASMPERMDAVRRELDAADQAYRPILAELQQRLDKAGQDLLAARAEQANAQAVGQSAQQGEIQRLQRILKEQQQAIEARNSRLTELQRNMEERDNRIAVLGAENTQRKEQLQAMSTRLRAETAQRHEQVASLSLELAQKSEHVEALLTSTSWRMTAPLRAVVIASRMLLGGESFRNLAAQLPDSREAGQIFAHMDCVLPEILYVGRGLSFHVSGWAFLRSVKPRRIEVRLGERSHWLRNVGLPRPDVFAVYRDPRSMFSGFSGQLDLESELAGQTLDIRIIAHFRGGRAHTIWSGSTRFLSELDFWLPVAHSKPRQALPLVAICMATYRPEIRAFREQIETIRGQTHPNWICIINDDASGAAKLKEMRQVIGSDSRFHFFQNDRNLGFYHNFENALRRVPPEADYVALSDQDDRWYPDKVARLLEKMEADPGTTLVYSDMRIVKGDGEVVSETYWRSRRNYYRDADLVLVANTVTGAASLFRRKLLEVALPFPQDIGRPFHDHFIACTALAEGRLEYIPEPLYDYVQHGTNVIGHSEFDQTSRLTPRRLLRALSGFSALRQDLNRFFLMFLPIYRADYVRLMLFSKTLLLRDVRHTAALRILDGGPLSVLRLLVLYLKVRWRGETTGGASWKLALSYVAEHLDVLVSHVRVRIMRRDRVASGPSGSLVSGGERAVDPTGMSGFLLQKTAPLRIATSPSQPRRISMLIPEINPATFFGGYMAKFHLLRKLAEWGWQPRALIVDWCDISPDEWQQRIFNRFPGLEDVLSDVEIEYCFDRERPVLMHPQDRLIATTWWTAHIARAALDSLECKEFLYLVQEYEPFTFPMGTMSALAHQTYGFPHRALFSSSLLQEYFAINRFGVYAQADGAVRSRHFENAIIPFELDPRVLQTRSSRKLLFYARPEPHATRNLFELGYLALSRAIERGTFGPEWEFHGIGSDTADLPLPGGRSLRMLGKVDLETYERTMPGYDVGLALMYTPHPSLLPLEMARAGLVVVTTSCLNKTPEKMQAISRNIICAEPELEAITAGLRSAAIRSQDAQSRFDAAIGTAWASDWGQAFHADIRAFIGDFAGHPTRLREEVAS